MSAPVSRDPAKVATADGAMWVRAAVTRAGLGLYVPEGVTGCPRFVMATLAELAEHGVRKVDELAEAVAQLGALPMPVGSSMEDPHDGPRHHAYKLGRDLPEADSYCSAPLPPSEALCATCGHNGAAHHHAGTACWADLPKALGESIRLCKCSAFAEVTR